MEYWLDALPLSFFSLCLCFIIAFALRKLRLQFVPRHLPPSPPSLPIIGHLHLLGQLPHQALYRLSRIHGPLMHLRLGSIPTIVASSPSMAREILQNQDLIFASRPHTSSSVYTHYNRSDIAWAPYGRYWRQVRQICVTELLSAKQMETFSPIRKEEVDRLLHSIWEDSTAAKEIPVKSKVLSMSNDVISRMIFGKRFSELASICQFDSSFDARSILEELLWIDAAFNIGDFLPWLQWLDVQGYIRRMKKLAQRMDLLLQGIMDQRHATREANRSHHVDKDLLDVLMSISGQEKFEGELLTDANIKSVIMDMFAAGTDTTAVTVEWAMAELLSKPKMMRKLQAEIDRVVGKNRRMQESDIVQLPYLRAVVKEAMRLHPVGPLLIPHESTKPCKVGGYDIPAKTRAIVNVWAVARDEAAWPEKPTEFWPDRFLGSEVDVKGQHFQLLPFGSGRRGCPGMNLGLLNVQQAVGCLVHGFQWALPRHNNDNSSNPTDILEEEDVPLDMSEKFGLATCMVEPLVAIATPRLPPHVYRAS